MKNLLSLTQLSKDQLSSLIETAIQMRRVVTAPYKKGPQLLGAAVAGVWAKQTQITSAVTIGAQYLSGSVYNFYAPDDPLEQCRIFDNMGSNIVVVGVGNDNICRNFADISKAAVLNGGSSQHNPVAALAMLCTLAAKLDSLQKITVLAVGNGSQDVLKELSYALGLYDSVLVRYLPPEDVVSVRQGVIFDNAETAFRGADAVIDLGLLPWSDASRYYGASAGIPEKLMDLARIDAPLLGSRTIVGEKGTENYPFSAVNTYETALASSAMAALYVLQKNS